MEFSLLSCIAPPPPGLSKDWCLLCPVGIILTPLIITELAFLIMAAGLSDIE
jgi:hypothetical protein